MHRGRKNRLRSGEMPKNEKGKTKNQIESGARNQPRGLFGVEVTFLESK